MSIYDIMNVEINEFSEISWLFFYNRRYCGVYDSNEKNVYKVYKNGVAALNGIDVSIQKVILYMW